MTTIIAIIALVISICAIYEIEKLKKNDVKNIEKALENSFEDYGRISIRSSKVTPCCSVPYFHVSFHINVDEII